MKKQNKKKSLLISHSKLVLFFASMLICFMGFAQQKTITGKVTDGSTGESLPGVTIVVKGTTNGTITNFDGGFSLGVVSEQTLVFSFIGYSTQEIVVRDQSEIKVQLIQSVENLEEVVVIGYGQVKKEDATGSVSAINSDDFNAGAITSPQELVSGKIAGVQIINGGGAPGAGATIRIRGGSSIAASNDPLIVIDGVPVDNDGISGMRNPLSTIHPADIETFTVLKDASATAIYGSRASNGVIIITTKKGKSGKGVKLEYNGNISVGVNFKEIDVLSANEFRNAVIDQFGSSSIQASLLGVENTDWQSEIYRTSVSNDHNLSLSGSLGKDPFRLSVGYSDQNGILKTSGLDRYTTSFGYSPDLMNGHLKVNLNFKGMYINNQFADESAINDAIQFDPTQPVYAQNSYGGFYAWLQPEGTPNNLAPTNPLAKLEMTDNESDVYRAIGNLQFDYKFHFLPELRANLNLGADFSTSEGTISIPENAAWLYNELNGGGRDTKYSQDKKNELLDFYLNYTKDIESILSRIDVMAGYSWQHFWRKETNLNKNANGTLTFEDTDLETENYLVSFFGRLNYTFNDKYLLTMTLRRDGSSRFSPDTRWGTFPSAALAWKINKEGFLMNSKVVSDLKLRLGYGITGQQNITDNDYPYLARYTYGEPNAQMQSGDQFIETLRAEGYDSNIKWEETTTYNIGLDYGFWNNRLTGTLDAYIRNTSDLINFVPVPGGANLTNQLLTNVGDLENRGVEFSTNAIIISKQDLSWEVGLNVTYNKNEIKKLTASDDPDYPGVYTGGSVAGTWDRIQIHSVGHPSYSFIVYEQIYGQDGKPIEGGYKDLDGDQVITNNDTRIYKKVSPDLYMGFSTQLNYKNWSFGLNGRASFGNYVYNNVWSNNSTVQNMYHSSNFLRNVNSNYLYTKFSEPQWFSDYYLQNASYLRIDNISLGYNFKNAFKQKMNINLFTTVQNALVITKYEGLDPEVDGGIDNNVYPRPVIYTLGVRIEL